jgi:hypothetical protein
MPDMQLDAVAGEKPSYTKIHVTDRDGLIRNTLLYSVFFVLCSLNKKKDNFNTLKLYI